jgi:hypothetical protein
MKRVNNTGKVIQNGYYNCNEKGGTDSFSENDRKGQGGGVP